MALQEFKSIHEELRLLDEKKLEADARIDNLALNTASRQSVEKLREDVDKLMTASGV